MAYIDTEDLRAYLGISGTADDDLLQEAVEDAQSYIESQTHRRFEANTETRYYDRDAINHKNSKILDLDEDLISITTLTNGDSSSTAIASTSYVLLPRNGAPPYHQIQLKTDVSDYWQFDTDYWVSVLGVWGYSETPPADIVRACTALAAYFYRQKDAQMFDTTAVLESGALVVPQGIPATVDRIIERYKRYI
jgi:hypothetical protein